MIFLRQHKKSIVVVAIASWIFVLAIGLARQPRSGHAGMSYSMMKQDIAFLLKNGGKVVESVDVLKPDRARVVRVIDVEGWSRSLMGKYQDSLLDKGWIQKNSTKFCKKGVLAKITANAGMRNGRESNLVAMEFDYYSLKECAVFPPK